MLEANEKIKIERLIWVFLFIFFIPAPVFMFSWAGFMPPAWLVANSVLLDGELLPILLALGNLFVVSGLLYIGLFFYSHMAERIMLPSIILRVFLASLLVVLVLMSIGNIYARYEFKGNQERMNIITLLPYPLSLVDKLLR